jgi:hypothetical protein
MKSPYIVYNILYKHKTDVAEIHFSIHTDEIADLYQKKDGIVEIEHFITPIKDKLEFRFTYENKEAYDFWMEKYKDRYIASVEKYQRHWQDNGITWERYTSDDCYISEFEGQSFLKLSNLLNWKASPSDKEMFVTHVAPLGKYQNYQGFGNFDTSIDFEGARFMKERHSSIRRFGNRPRAFKDHNFPAGLMAYHFDHAIDVLQYPNKNLYTKLKTLCYDVESVAEKYITSCNYAAVIAGHKNLGNAFKLHSHRLDDYDRFTFTIIVRLSNHDSSEAVFQAYDPYKDDDPTLPHYYAAPWYIESYIEQEKLKPVNIPLKTDVSLLVFNASYCPHSVVWSDDLYLFFVYDHVNFREGALDYIIKKSEYHCYQDRGQNKLLLYHGI